MFRWLAAMKQTTLHVHDFMFYFAIWITGVRGCTGDSGQEFSSGSGLPSPWAELHQYPRYLFQLHGVWNTINIKNKGKRSNFDGFLGAKRTQLTVSQGAKPAIDD